jgi:two-component system response regulator HydG
MERKPRLLVVDDEEIALFNLAYVLKKEGYDIVTSQSGPTALKRLEQEEFTVVVTDLRMPKVDGMEILEQCRELQPNTPVIMVTGYAAEHSAAEAMEKGAYHHIAKPFRLDEVRKVVAKAVKEYRLRKSIRP